MIEGTIKSVLVDRGFGFISVPNADDVFFHFTALEDGLAFDETLLERRVRYSVISSPRGPKAVCIQAVE